MRGLGPARRVGATVRGSGFPAVTRVFRRCYTPRRSDGWDNLPTSWTLALAAYSARVVTERVGTGPVDGSGEPEYAGQRLGMPPTGPGSMALLNRRVPAILVDWLLCQLITIGLLGVPLGAGGPRSFVVLGVFALENLLLVVTLGSTVGHRLLGLQVLQVRRDRFPVQVLVRTGLLCLFLPALFTDAGGRGFHDRAAGTVLVRR